MVKMMLKKYGDLKISRKLIIVFLVVIILPELALSIFASYFSGYTIKNEVMKSTQETIRQINDNIDSEITLVMNTAMQVISDKRVKDIVEGVKADDNYVSAYDGNQYIKDFIDAAFATSFSVENVYICSYNGMTFTSSKNYLSLTKDYDFTRTRWFETMKRTKLNTLVLSGYDSSAVIPKSEIPKIFTIVKKIYGDPKGKEIGCIILELSSDMFGNLLQNTNMKKGQNVLIVDNNKKIVYHQDSNYIGTQFRSNYISEALKMRDGYLEDEGENKLVTFTTSNITDWSVIYEVRAENILINIDRLQIIILFTTILCISLSIYYAFIVSKSISEPIIQLQKKMKQVSKGDFDIDIDMNTMDEVGQLTSSFDKMVKKTKQLIENVYQSEIYQKEAELNALQAQINPHFLYNTLQTIDMMAEAEGAYHISEACQSLAKIFRYAINRGQEFVHLSEEISHIKNYMIIQKLRFGKKVNIVYDVESECEELFIVKLLVQPLVENAIVHGIENSIGMCTVTVRGYQKDGNLYIEVEDDGDGISKDQLAIINENLDNYSQNDIVHKVTYNGTHSSIGLVNTNARIKLYFGGEYGIKLRSKEGERTLVQLCLPIKKT